MIQSLVVFVITMMLFTAQLSAKIRILTFHYNKPDFIELQHKTFKKFMLDEYELIVFNDGNTPERERSIREMCEKQGIACIRFEQEWHGTDPLNTLIEQWLHDPAVYSHLTFSNSSLEGISRQPSVRHCHVIQYALDHFGYTHDDIVVIMDGDAFLTKPFDLRALLANCAVAGIQRLISEDEIDYFWVVFTAFNPQKLDDLKDFKFHVDLINNKVHDSGAHTYHYLQNHPQVIAKKYPRLTSASFRFWKEDEIKGQGFDKSEVRLIQSLPPTQEVEFHVDKQILHFGASSFDLEWHEFKSQCVCNYLNEILRD